MLSYSRFFLIILVSVSSAFADEIELKKKCPDDDWAKHTSCVHEEVNHSREQLTRTIETIAKRIQSDNKLNFAREQKRWEQRSNRACEKFADEDCPVSECTPVKELTKGELESKRSGSMWKIVYGYCIYPKFNARNIQLRKKYEVR